MRPPRPRTQLPSCSRSVKSPAPQLSSRRNAYNGRKQPQVRAFGSEGVKAMAGAERIQDCQLPARDSTDS